MAAKKIPFCCEGCDSWEKHREECHFYWDLKKDCSMHSDRQDF